MCHLQVPLECRPQTVVIDQGKFKNRKQRQNWVVWYECCACAVATPQYISKQLKVCRPCRSATVFGNQFLSAVKQSVVFGASHHLYCMANSSYNLLKSSPMKFLCADNVWDMTLWYATFMFNYYCLGKLRGILPEVAGRVGEDLAMLHSIERDLKFYFFNELWMFTKQCFSSQSCEH